MSVTLMRNKNGKQVPIKLSIWDAFKGAPIPKPRLHECGACGRLHKPVCKPKTGDKKGDKDSESIKSKESKKSKEGDRKSESGFTAEEDAKIKEMKAEDPSCAWVKVAEALDNKHNKDACKQRFKELQDAEKGNDEKVAKCDDGGKKNKGKNDKNGKKDSSSDHTPADRSMTKKEKKAAAREADEKKSAVAEFDPTATVETTKPTEEIQTAPASADDKQKWIAAAAKHFDRTGQRITAEQARKLAEEST